MLGQWGYSGSRTSVAVLVSGVWNAFAKLALPILTLALIALQGNATGGRMVAALAGSPGWWPPSWSSPCCSGARSWPAASGSWPAGSPPDC